MNRLRNISRWLLPMLFAGYWCCISLFMHSHTVGGRVVTHSHPFEKLPHSSAGQLLTLAAVSHFAADSAGVFAQVPECTWLTLAPAVCPSCRQGTGVAVASPRLRGPPCAAGHSRWL